MRQPRIGVLVSTAAKTVLPHMHSLFLYISSSPYYKYEIFNWVAYPREVSPMFEIRFHGRGGQGSVVASDILAKAVFFEGKDVQSFPFFGVERRGAPVLAFTRIDDKPIRVKTSIYAPDCVVVLDQSLLKSQNVTAGLKEDGFLLVNSDKRPEELALHFKGVTATVDATDIALRHGIGSKTSPIVNTAILGALAKITGMVKFDSVAKAIIDSVPNKSEQNVAAAKEAFEEVVTRRVAD